jgi:hypothetical protein
MSVSTRVGDRGFWRHRSIAASPVKVWSSAWPRRPASGSSGCSPNQWSGPLGGVQGEDGDTERHSGVPRRAWHPTLTSFGDTWSDCPRKPKAPVAHAEKAIQNEPNLPLNRAAFPRHPTSSCDKRVPGTYGCLESRPCRGTWRSSWMSPPCRPVRYRAEGPTSVDSSGPT